MPTEITPKQLEGKAECTLEEVTTVHRVKGLPETENMVTRMKDAVAVLGDRAKLGEPFRSIPRLVVTSVMVERDIKRTWALVVIRHEERDMKGVGRGIVVR